MRNSNKITCWENTRRLEQLNLFREHVETYFNNSQPGGGLGESRVENENASSARRSINFMTYEIHKIVFAAGILPSVHWLPPPVVGGADQEIDVLQNLFVIQRFSISPNQVIDFIEQAIGVYQSDQRGSVFRTFNPFWWIGQLLEWLAHVPFALIGAAGFDAVRAEKKFAWTSH